MPFHVPGNINKRSAEDWPALVNIYGLAAFFPSNSNQFFCISDPPAPFRLVVAIKHVIGIIASRITVAIFDMLSGGGENHVYTLRDLRGRNPCGPGGGILPPRRGEAATGVEAHAQAVRVMRTGRSDPGAAPIIMVQEIDYPTMEAVDEALASPVRLEGRAITDEMMSMCDGRFYHLVYKRIA